MRKPDRLAIKKRFEKRQMKRVRPKEPESLIQNFFGCKIMNCFCLRPPYLLQNAGTDALIVFVDYLDTMHRNTTDLYNAQMGLGVGREAAILHLPQALPILFADSFVNAGSRGTFHWR